MTEEPKLSFAFCDFLFFLIVLFCSWVMLHRCLIFCSSSCKSPDSRGKKLKSRPVKLPLKKSPTVILMRMSVSHLFPPRKHSGNFHARFHSVMILFFKKTTKRITHSMRCKMIWVNEKWKEVEINGMELWRSPVISPRVSNSDGGSVQILYHSKSATATGILLPVLHWKCYK